MTKKKDLPLPTDVQLAKLASAAAASADGKHRAGLVLLEARQWPEAFANAALGFEELGKAHLCGTMIFIPPQFRADFTPRGAGVQHGPAWSPYAAWPLEESLMHGFSPSHDKQRE